MNRGLSSLLLAVGCTATAPEPPAARVDPAPAGDAKEPAVEDSPLLVCARGIEPQTGLSASDILSRFQADLERRKREGTLSLRGHCNADEAMHSRVLEGLMGLERASEETGGLWDLEASMWPATVDGCHTTVPTWERRATADYHAIVVHAATDTLDDAVPYLVDLEAYFSDDPVTAIAERCFSDAVVERARTSRPTDGFNALTATVPPSGIPECDALEAKRLCIRKSLLKGRHDEVRSMVEDLAATKINPEEREALREYCVQRLTEGEGDPLYAYDCALPSPAAEVEAMALRCDGAALLGLGTEAIAALAPNDAPPSARLLAIWERDRVYDGAFAEALTTELGLAPPAWWVETLRSGRGGEGAATFYDLQVKPSEDRRGPLESGPGGIRVRPGLTLVESGGGLAYDLSMTRVPLGPIPPEGTAVEVVRAHAGTTLFVAAFEPDAGGFRFPLRAVASDGTETWTTEVCAADRKVLGGVGSMIAQLVVLEDPPAKPGVKGSPVVRGLAVFTAETHGVTVEVFDVDTGSRTLTWSSDLWSWRG